MVPFAVRTLGPERVVFGSDAPGAGLINNLAKVLAEPLDRETVERILRRNALDLIE
jgi:predicted TIM-barrel fold metal-dependent hydrolase